jgi:hypothetical protein
MEHQLQLSRSQVRICTTRQIHISPPPNPRNPLSLSLPRRMPRFDPLDRRIINKRRSSRNRSRKSRRRSTLRPKLNIHGKKREYIFIGLPILILGTFAGVGKSLPPAFHKSNVLPRGCGSGLRRLGPTLTLCVMREGVCSTGPYLRRKLARLAPLAP